MEIKTRTKRRYRAARHIERSAKRALRDAGARSEVARTLGRSISTISHEVSDRCHPTLKAAFDTLLLVVDGPKTTGRAFAEAATELVELVEIVQADDAVLIERGLFLMDHENKVDAVEDCRSLHGPVAHSDALRKVASVAAELASILAELWERGIDLHALNREVAA